MITEILNTIIVPFFVGIATNKASDKLFEDENLSIIVQQIYHESESEFNRKYQNLYGGKYSNFIARQENIDIILNKVLNYRRTDEIEGINKESFDGKFTPDEVVQDFINIFEKNLIRDDRLAKYRIDRNHNLVTEEILEEILKLTYIKVKKFDNALSINLSKKVKPYTIEKTKKEIEKVCEYLKKYEIVIVDSYRNFGKTELLYKLPLNNEIKGMFEYIIVMNHGVRDIFDALKDEIVEGKTYLILIDNVELCENEFIELIRYVKASKCSCKIVATVQTYMLEKIKNSIINEGLVKYLKNISLNGWKKKDFIEVLKKSGSQYSVDDEELIAIRYPSPSLVSWIGESKINSKVESVEELFNEYREVMLNDVHNILKGMLSIDESDKLIFSISCTVPLDFNDIFKKHIKELIGIDEALLEKIFSSLTKGGIIRKVGYKYRFLPDIKGDIYLAYSLKNNLFIKEVNYWINNNEERMFENINLARFIYKIDINEILNPIINEWFAADDYFTQSSILKKAIHIVSFAPSSILSLIYSYLQFAIDSDKEKYYKLNNDQFGPLLLKLWKLMDEKEEILNFVRMTEIYNLNGVYSNYKVEGMVKEFFSPVNSSIEVISDSLGIIEKWLQKEEEKSLIIAKYAISEILKGTHEVSKITIHVVKYGDSAVNATTEVISIRNKCISIIKYLVNEKFNYDVIKTIKEICQSIGTGSMGCIKENELPLYSEIVYERECLVDMLGTKLLTSNDISCNIVIEEILIWWWVSQFKGTEKSEKYLIEFTKSYEYLFSQYYANTVYNIYSFKEISKSAPKTDRAIWIIRDAMSNDNLGKNIERLAIALNNEINTVGDFAILLNNSAEIIKKIGARYLYPEILEKWCSLNEALFLEYIDSSYYSETYELFKGYILGSIVSINTVANNEKLIRSLIGNLEELSYYEINSILNICANKELNNDLVVNVICTIAKGYQLEYPSNFINTLYIIFKERDRKVVIKILTYIITEYKFDKLMRNSLDIILKRFINDLREYCEFIELKDIIVERLVGVDDFDYYENSILETLLNNGDEALDFLIKRMLIEGNYRAMPLYGYTYLRKFIIHENEYDKVITKLIDLEEEGKIISTDKGLIYDQLFMAKDSDKELIINKLLNIYINENNSRGVIEILEYYKLFLNTLDQFIKGIIYLEKIKMHREAEKIIVSHRYPYDGFSRSIGSSSPEILERIELYKEMNKCFPYGRLKIITENCIEYLKKDIKVDLIRDEEILNPR